MNANRRYCYRITHIENLPYILEHGLLNKNHILANPDYIHIGNQEIIDVRTTTKVKIFGYGFLGEYVPFYFTPKSIMLYNIVTGYYHPTVPKRSRNEILVIRCLIEDLADLTDFFFTDGQGNDLITEHHNDLQYLDEIDWLSIQQSDFTKSDGDYDRPRRYQAEFLVRNKVPLEKIESFNVYNDEAADIVMYELSKKLITNLPVYVRPQYFFA